MATHIEGCPECRKFLEPCVDDGLKSLPTPPAQLPGPDTVPRIEGFTIERELGRGAMGVVYLARRDTLRRQVALKLLPGGRRAGPRERRHWLREAEAASLVRHPNIVTLHEVDEADDWFLLVLEYVPGGTLADRLLKPLAPGNAARLMETIARAVHHIHLSGQLHLDLKPSNILLDGEPGAGWDAVTPKVSDFGIARTSKPGATDSGGPGPGGTPSYMAPEQITKAREDMSARADIHGLGAILYHMLTGRPPYQGATVLETIDLVQRQDPVPPRRLNPKIPADLETICLKCLEKDPVRRYASAELLAGDLGRWQGGRPISARPVSPLGKSWRWCRRRPVVAALTAALTLSLSVGFVAVVLLWRQAEAARTRAEKNFNTSNDVITDLVKLSIGGQNHLPKAMTLDRLIPLLEKVRKRVRAISRTRPDDLRMARQLADVEGRLSESLLQARRREDARTIALESLAKLDRLAGRKPWDESVCDARSSRLHFLAEVSEGMGKSEESVIYLGRAIQLHEEEIRLAPCASGYDGLLFDRRALAWLHFRRGDREQAASLFAANARLLESLPSTFSGINTPVQRFKADVDSKLCGDGSASPRARGTARQESGDKARLSSLRSPTDASQPPQEWARLAAQAIRSSNRPDPASAASRDSEDALNVTRYLTEIASTFRRVHDIDGARRIAERILALGDHFVATYPGQPAAHLVLNQAYIQLYKNALQTNNQAAVEANMTRALDAAQIASLRDPNSENAQRAVYDLQRRLANLSAKP